ncbi:Hypothetical protein FKW44_004211 [Caligus rogercresseyi]|uniref:Uncharacterized protein n=1 Tax=Caligus rogercresseyi TaxID=217165 RepID=A0A7T8HLJ5_CALRO|nr:Hypothetical protein FKW44_004211 [Caligus rogercresseyi]
MTAITETEFNEAQSASFAIKNYTTFLPLADGDGKRRIVMLVNQSWLRVHLHGCYPT